LLQIWIADEIVSADRHGGRRGYLSFDFCDLDGATGLVGDSSLELVN
jgi:hypothetical protein